MLTTAPAATRNLTDVTSAWTIPPGTSLGAQARLLVLADGRGGGSSAQAAAAAAAAAKLPQPGALHASLRLTPEDDYLALLPPGGGGAPLSELALPL